MPENEPESVSLSDLVQSFDSVKVEAYLEPKTLDKLVQPFSSLEFIEAKTKSSIQRFRATVSGALAITLWVALFYSAWWQTHMAGFIAVQMVNLASSHEAGGEEIDFQPYDKAAAVIGDTSKTLYAVITPLATAVTGFYFVSRSDASKKKKESGE